MGPHCVFNLFQSNNVTVQKKYKAEITELHDALLQVKRDYDLLRMEFEQNLKANEQTGLCGSKFMHLCFDMLIKT